MTHPNTCPGSGQLTPLDATGDEMRDLLFTVTCPICGHARMLTGRVVDDLGEVPGHARAKEGAE